MRSAFTLGNVRVVLPGKFSCKIETESVDNTQDRTYKIIKWIAIIAVPVIIAVAYYISTHASIGDVLG